VPDEGFEGFDSEDFVSAGFDSAAFASLLFDSELLPLSPPDFSPVLLLSPLPLDDEPLVRCAFFP
jgi:hypothetical protein